MQYTSIYNSPIGEILLVADDVGIVGVWFKGQKHYARYLDKENCLKETPYIKELKRWLDIYFSGSQPDFEPQIHMLGTPFQIEVWNILRGVPYGKTTTYSAIAKQIATKRGLKTMSAQAVGSAVGKNNLSVIIPCHRVIAKNNSLAGYAGGIDKKIFLLKLEGVIK